MSGITVSNLCKTYIVNKRQNNVLRNVNLTLEEKEMIAVMGPSGSGKTTLLYTISGMDSATAGSVKFFERELTDMSRNEISDLRLEEMGFVFQQMYMLKNLSVFIGNRDFHFHNLLIFLGPQARAAATASHTAIPPGAVPAGTLLSPGAEHIVSAGDVQAPPLHQGLSQPAPGGVVHLLHRGAGHPHLGGALLLGAAQQVDEADGLVLLHRHLHPAVRRPLQGAEAAASGQGTDASAFFGSGHSVSSVSGLCHLL